MLLTEIGWVETWSRTAPLVPQNVRKAAFPQRFQGPRAPTHTNRRPVAQPPSSLLFVLFKFTFFFYEIIQIFFVILW